jgi:hypothetical protein
MFDGPSDMVVIPCSTVPTITAFVQKRLQAFRIAQPSGAMALGDVQFQPLAGAEQLAAWVAFAASVANYYSTEESVEKIAEAIGSFARTTAGVRRIAAPLLGAGAGQLGTQAVVARMKAGFLRSAPDGAVLTIFVLDEFEFTRLTESAGPPRAEPPAGPQERGALETVHQPRQPIRVLLSYTKTTPEHADWVKSLATSLRSSGIDARLDTWHLRLGMDVAQWMCNEIDLAERVLLICNEEYARRADGRHGGVGWEIRLVQGDLLAHQSTNPEKYIPIVRTLRTEDGLPAFLLSAFCLHWPPDAPSEPLQQALVKEIYRKHEEAPPIGEPPSYVV